MSENRPHRVTGGAAWPTAEKESPAMPTLTALALPDQKLTGNLSPRCQAPDCERELLSSSARKYCSWACYQRMRSASVFSALQAVVLNQKRARRLTARRLHEAVGIPYSTLAKWLATPGRQLRVSNAALIADWLRANGTDISATDALVLQQTAIESDAQVRGPSSRRTPTPLGRAILARSGERGLNKGETARLLEVSYSTMWKMLYERGYQPQRPRWPNLLTFLGLTPGALVKVTGRSTRVDRCEGRGRYQGSGCGAENVRRPSDPRRKRGLCAACWRRAHRVTLVCHYDLCGRRFERPQSTAKQTLNHFCCRAHFEAWNRGRRRLPHRSMEARLRRPRGRPQRRRATAYQRVSGLPSYSAIAEATGVSRETVSKVMRRTTHAGRLTRRRLERSSNLQDQGWPRLTAAILDHCIDTNTTLRALAARIGISPPGLSALLDRGAASAAVVARLAGEMSCEVAALEAMCPAARYTSSRQLVSVLFLQASRTGDVPSDTAMETIIARVTERHPSAKPESLRAYMERKRRAARGRGRPRTFTDREAREVMRLRDEERLSWARIGTRMGWPVKVDRMGKPCFSPKAKAAYDSAKTP